MFRISSFFKNGIHKTKVFMSHIHIEDIPTMVRKRVLLLRGDLVKKRKVTMNIPLMGVKTHIFSISDLCGHGAFVMLALSYLESDFLHLRVYAMTGITLSIIFQYYREKPLWIPIRWNTLFLCINGIMLIIILKESHDAENMNDELKTIYQSIFQHYGMKSIDFLHLMSLATRHKVLKGEKLVTLGNTHHHLHFVQSGTLSVKRKHDHMPEIHENQFVGAMSFMNWEGNLATKKRLKRLKHEDFKQWNSDASSMMNTIPYYDYYIDEITEDDRQFISSITSHYGHTERKSTVIFITVLSFLFGFITYEEFKANINETRQIKSANNTNTTTTNTTNNTTAKPSREPSSNTSNNSSTSKDSKVDQNMLNVVTSTDIITTPEEDIEVAGGRGLADVTCEVDCVVYTWDFHELRELLVTSPGLGLVFERCISADLNRKMSTNWSRNTNIEKYKELLYWLLVPEDITSNNKNNIAIMAPSTTNTTNSSNMSASPINNNTVYYKYHEITDRDRHILYLYRQQYNISREEHELLVSSLGWTLEEFNGGYKGNQDILYNRYMQQLEQECKQKAYISPKVKKKLQEYRIENKISTNMHMKALNALGWTYEDYERGYKDEYKTMKLQQSYWW